MRGTDPLRLAERILTLLSDAAYTATYKYAVLLGLMDLCIEGTSAKGVPPQSVTTRQLAEKVLEIYWPHTALFSRGRRPSVLLQNSGKPGSQAVIISDIIQFRNRWAPDPSASMYESRRTAPLKFERLIQKIEEKLIEMPLARLQYAGARDTRFLYDIGWTRDQIKGKAWSKLRADVRAYQQGSASGFDNTIRFLDGVGPALVRLNGLLRPLIHRQWSDQVAQLNRLPEAELERFLFRHQRIATKRLRGDLLDLQDHRCFYCDGGIREDVEIDHFVPWSRVPDDGIENLVAAHATCNGDKRDFIAGNFHLERWLDRHRRADSDLSVIADQHAWDSHPHRTLGIVRSVYLGLGDGHWLWARKKELVAARPDDIRRILAA